MEMTNEQMDAAVAFTLKGLAKLKKRQAKAEKAARLAASRAILADYYANSVGGSVLADYAAGNVVTIQAGE